MNNLPGLNNFESKPDRFIFYTKQIKVFIEENYYTGISDGIRVSLMSAYIKYQRKSVLD